MLIISDLDGVGFSVIDAFLSKFWGLRAVWSSGFGITILLISGYDSSLSIKFLSVFGLLPPLLLLDSLKIKINGDYLFTSETYYG